MLEKAPEYISIPAGGPVSRKAGFDALQEKSQSTPHLIGQRHLRPAVGCEPTNPQTTPCTGWGVVVLLATPRSLETRIRMRGFFLRYESLQRYLALLSYCLSFSKRPVQFPSDPVRTGCQHACARHGSATSPSNFGWR